MPESDEPSVKNKDRGIEKPSVLSTISKFEVKQSSTHRLNPENTSIGRKRKRKEEELLSTTDFSPRGNR